MDQDDWIQPVGKGQVMVTDDNPWFYRRTHRAANDASPFPWYYVGDEDDHDDNDDDDQWRTAAQKFGASRAILSPTTKWVRHMI